MMPRADKLLPASLVEKDWLSRRLRLTLLILTGAIVVTILLLAIASPALSQGDRFGIPWFSIDGGGGSVTATRFDLDGSIGQPDAGAASSERFSVFGGFRAPEVRDALVDDGRIFLPSLRLRD